VTVKPGAVHHVAIQVRDLAAAERWYAAVLGLPLLKRWQDAEGRDRSSWLALEGDAFLALEVCKGRETPVGWESDAPGLYVLALRIAPTERVAWERRLADHGVVIERQSQWTIYFRDPEGNRLGLSSHPES
jgi:catechol 2,3-dioxygenase-like lactoylglutathione lyase family enzyme